MFSAEQWIPEYYDVYETKSFYERGFKYNMEKEGDWIVSYAFSLNTQ